MRRCLFVHTFLCRQYKLICATCRECKLPANKSTLQTLWMAWWCWWQWWKKKKETKRGFRVPRIIHPWIPWKLVHTHKYTFLCRQYEPICTTYREFKLPAVILKSSAKKKKITNNLNDMVVLVTAVEKKKTKPGFRVPRITHPSIPEKIVHTHKWGNVFLCTRSCADNTNRFVQHVVNANCWL